MIGPEMTSKLSGQKAISKRGVGADPLDCPGLQRGSAPDWIAFPNCARKLGPRFGSYRTSAAADE